MQEKLLNINLFGGPGTGKTTTASGIFYKLKTNGYKIEYIQEYAKELTFGQDKIKLSDQLLILSEQHHRMFRMKNQLDYIVHDSPFIMGLVYFEEDPHLPKKQFNDLIVEMHKSYNNLNIFLKRNVKEHEYQEYGRNQTLDEAIQKDNEIKKMLNDNGIPYYEIEIGKKTVKSILKQIKKQKDI